MVNFCTDRATKFDIKMEKQKEGNAERLLKSFGQKIDDLISKAKENSEGLDEKFEDRMEEFKRNWQKMDQDIQNFTEEHKDKIKDVGIEIERAARDLKKSVASAFSKEKTD